MGRTVSAERSLEGILKSLLLSQSGRSRLKTAVLVGHIVSTGKTRTKDIYIFITSIDYSGFRVT